MNYGKENSEKIQKNLSSKNNMNKKRIGVRLFKAVIICILLLIVLAIVGCGLFVKKVLDDSPTVTPEQVRPSGYTTFIYADDGTELERFVSAGANRIYKSIDEIPEDLAHAFVAIEDERFYQHNGIDLQGILRAAVVGITSGGNFSEGASTLTQQLIKNNVFPNFINENTFYERLERKLQEQFLALDIEKQMSKDQIVEAYMNTINLGQNCLGVQSAAQRYFNKNVSDLTLSEDAVIAGITQNPTTYDPVVNPEANAERRTIVLSNMLEQGYITQEAYDEAMADDVYSRIAQNASVADESPYTYFIDELAKQVIQDLQDKKGYSYSQAYNALYSGGLTINTTQNLGIQGVCDEEANNPANYPWLVEYGLTYVATITRADGSVENYSTESLRAYLDSTGRGPYSLVFSSEAEAQQAVDEYKATLNVGEGDTIDDHTSISPQPQTSVVVMDQHTGYVKAIVGGRGEKDTSLSLNRATESPRQPGSCFKILSAYAPAIDIGGYTLATTILDEKYYYPNDPEHREVKNWWGDYYKGNMTVRKAIEQSANVCAVKTLADIGTQTGYDYLENFGFTTLVGNDDPDFPGYTDIALPTALGGITRGVYNLDMTAAYAAIANGGVYTEPILYTQILDHDGNVLLDNTPDTRRVLKESTAALLTSAMEDVITQGTGTTARLSSMPAAGKTGTTSDDVDIWLSAYTPYLTCSVWAGYDSNKPLSAVGTTFHEVIWQRIMERLNGGLPEKDFTMPADVEQKTICTQTGLIANSGCPAITEYFATGSIPDEVCAGHGYSNYNYRDESNSWNNNSNYNNTPSTDTPTNETTPTTPEDGSTTPETPVDGGSTTPETPPADGGGETPPETPPADGGGETPPAE